MSDWKLFVDLETMGYDAAWAADLQMLYSDAYAVLALAAEHTSRIRLGTGVSVAGVRLAPVTAHSIATINKLAPGRTFLGIGTGHTAMRVMGKDPVKARDFREYLRVLRALLHGKEVDYALADGERTDIRFLHPDCAARQSTSRSAGAGEMAFFDCPDVPVALVSALNRSVRSIGLVTNELTPIL